MGFCHLFCRRFLRGHRGPISDLAWPACLGQRQHSFAKNGYQYMISHMTWHSTSWRMLIYDIISWWAWDYFRFRKSIQMIFLCWLALLFSEVSHPSYLPMPVDHWQPPFLGFARSNCQKLSVLSSFVGADNVKWCFLLLSEFFGTFQRHFSLFQKPHGARLHDTVCSWRFVFGR